MAEKTEEGANLPRRPTNPRGGVGFLELIVVCVLAVGAGLFVYDRYFATKVVAVDFRAYQDAIQQGLREGTLSDPGGAMAELDVVLQSLPPNHVVVERSVVFRTTERDVALPMLENQGGLR